MRSTSATGVDRLRSGARAPLTAGGFAWFGVTGVLNGGAVLLLYSPLTLAPVSTVSPIVATYPLVTALLSAALLRDERVTLRVVAGAAVTVAAVAYLVASQPAA